MKYIYCFILATPKKIEESNRYDLPFPIYSQCTSHGNVCYYEQIPDKLVGLECLVYVAYNIADESKVKAYAGYLGDDWKEVRKNVKATEKWNVTKEIALAVTTQDKIDPMKQVVVKYTGIDKDDVIHPYSGDDKK